MGFCNIEVVTMCLDGLDIISLNMTPPMFCVAYDSHLRDNWKQRLGQEREREVSAHDECALNRPEAIRQTIAS